MSGKRENIAPDYPLTLLEGLTTITHYCLLDNKRVRNEPYSICSTHTPMLLIYRSYNDSLFSFFFLVALTCL